MALPETITPHAPTRPIVLVALAHLAGLVIGLDLTPPDWCLISSIFICLCITSINWWRSRRIHGPQLASGALLLFAIGAFGALQGSHLVSSDRDALAQMAPWLSQPALTVTGVVAEPPRVGPDWAEIVVGEPVLKSREKAAERMGLNIALRLNDVAAKEFIAKPELLPCPGQPIRAEGWLRPITSAANPSTFNSERYWLSREIGARMNIDRPGRILVGPPPATWRAWLDIPMRKLRLAIGRTLDYRLSPDSAKLARALVLGQAEMISEDARDAFRLAGWAHLLAVSGQNAGIVLLIVIALCHLVFIPPRASSCIAIAAVIFYMALTAFLPPVTRAGIMTIFLLVGFAIGRASTGFASLAAAAFVTLILDSRNLTRIDWQLSYVCVLSMVLITPPIYEWASLPIQNASRTKSTLNRFIILPVAVSIAIQLGLLPLQIAYFRQVNILIVLSNIFGIFVASLATIGAMATAALGWIPGAGYVLGFVTNGFLVSLSKMAEGFASLPWFELTLPVLTPIIVALFYGALLTGRWLRTGKGENVRLDRDQRLSLVRHMCASVAVLAFALIWIPLIHSAPQDALDIYMLDVGQGDCIVLCSGGRTMVVDAGPKDRGRLAVEPFLRTMNIDKIDCLVATHADADHIGGMAELVDHFPIGEFVQGNDVSDSELYADLTKEVAVNRVHTVKARAGDLIDGFGQTKIRLLGPVPGLTDNNGSVVLLVEHGDNQFLLMGDLEQAGEEKLEEARVIPDVEVIKVGHHGSRSSTGAELLKESRPELALISVGENNRFGHPSPEVVARLNQAHAQLMRTDQHGAIWLHSDGRKIEAYRYKN